MLEAGRKVFFSLSETSTVRSVSVLASYGWIKERRAEYLIGSELHLQNVSERVGACMYDHVDMCIGILYCT